MSRSSSRASLLSPSRSRELGSGLDAICARESEKLSIRAIRGYNPADGMLQQILFPDDAKSAGKEL